MFQDFTDGENIEYLVKDYNINAILQNISVKNPNRWLITFPNQIFYDLIIKEKKNISKQILEINKNIEKVESILYVGGYCSNEIMYNYLKNDFKNIAHLKPSHPEIAVVKGAVLFGINPNIIVERKAKYTIDLSINAIWIEEIHDKNGVKYFDDVSNNYR